MDVDGLCRNSFGDHRVTVSEAPAPIDVVRVLAGVSEVGRAARMFAERGWSTRIAGNRISIGDRLFVRFVGEYSAEPGEERLPIWVVYGSDDWAPIWVRGWANLP